MNSEVSNQIVDTVFKVLIDGSKQDYIGEKISQLEHSLQAAAQALETSNIFLLICLFFFITTVLFLLLLTNMYK